MATGTYKPLATGQAPTLGTSGDAVKALQTQLNTQNAGKAGYTPLVVDGKYGPLTQQATLYKAPADTSNPPEAPNTDPTRFIRTANSNDSEINRLTRDVVNETSNAPDLASITAKNREQAQGLIDYIDQQFQKTLADQTEVNNGLNNRVRALNVNSGLGGSDFATASAIGQEAKNKKAIDMINAEKAAKIEAVLSGVDQRSSEQYQTERTNYVNSLRDNLDLLTKAKDEDRKRATDSIAGLAGAGISIDKLKTADPASYNTLLKEYGGSQLDLETVWNSKLPDNMKVQYDQKTLKGANGNAVILRYGFDPVTGKTTSKEYDTGIAYEKLATGSTDIKEVDGRLWSIATGPDGKQTATPLTDVSALTQSIINKNNADAKKAGNDSGNPFSFTGTQKSKLLSANFTSSKISAIQSDLNQYGLSAVLDGLSTEEEKNAIKEALKGSSLADQLAEYIKTQQ